MRMRFLEYVGVRNVSLLNCVCKWVCDINIVHYLLKIAAIIFFKKKEERKV